MWDLINNLPFDIFNYVLSFTYKPQSDILLKDIRTYVEYKIIISCVYEKRYHDLIEYEKDADKNWLVSDILLYIKKNKFDYYKRCVYIYNDFIFCKKDICCQFNIFWGLLTSEERKHFVQIRS
jgi:hypothetical protein